MACSSSGDGSISRRAFIGATAASFWASSFSMRRDEHPGAILGAESGEQVEKTAFQ